jgi:multidrug transporter EmrE-like cation transporter
MSINILFEPLIISGVLCYFLSFLLFLPWLNSRPAGVAVPAAGLTYALVAIIGWFRGDCLSAVQVGGIIAIGCGVWALSH